jgi:hypothetical protein
MEAILQGDSIYISHDDIIKNCGVGAKVEQVEQYLRDQKIITDLMHYRGFDDKMKLWRFSVNGEHKLLALENLDVAGIFSLSTGAIITNRNHFVAPAPAPVKLTFWLWLTYWFK